jgi:hypothetical protein
MDTPALDFVHAGSLAELRAKGRLVRWLMRGGELDRETGGLT